MFVRPAHARSRGGRGARHRRRLLGRTGARRRAEFRRSAGEQPSGRGSSPGGRAARGSPAALPLARGTLRGRTGAGPRARLHRICRRRLRRGGEALRRGIVTRAKGGGDQGGSPSRSGACRARPGTRAIGPRALRTRAKAGPRHSFGALDRERPRRRRHARGGLPRGRGGVRRSSAPRTRRPEDQRESRAHAARGGTHGGSRAPPCRAFLLPLGGR